MIRLHISKIRDGVICAQLTSDEGGKVLMPDGNSFKVSGITKSFPIQIFLRENTDYFLTDSQTKLLRERVNEFKANIRENNN